MRTTAEVKNAKLALRLEICEMQTKLREMQKQLKELDEVEVLLFEREFGTTKCETYDFNKPKKKPKRTAKEFEEELADLTPEQRATLLTLLKE
jgi:translation initiation factor IF-3